MVGATGRTARRRGLPLFPFALVLAAAVVPACFDLQKVDPGPRVLDDFETGDLTMPSWTRFGKWSCSALTSSQPDGGQDAGDDAGGDAGQDQDGGGVEVQPANCEVDTPGSVDMHALRYRFVLDEPADGNQPLRASVVTKTVPGYVDVSGFKQLVFSAYLAPLHDAPSIGPLPQGTLFRVELGCSAFINAPVASYIIGVPFEGDAWAPAPFTLPLDQFHQTGTSQSRGCLAQVDSIGFTILLPTLMPGASTGGTLHIDNISLLN